MNLKEKPYYLTEEEISWVESQKSRLSTEQKVGQLMCVMGGDFTIDTLKTMVQEKGVGGVLYRPAPAEEISENFKVLDAFAPVPLLKAANLEEGGSGGVSEGTLFGWPMTVGASGDPEEAKTFAKVCAAEAKTCGINWTFSPVADRSINPLNPITNVRAFGVDTELVETMTEAYSLEIQRLGIAACAKHFPGDGVDFRDQHLHPTYNSLSAEDWYESYGKIYQNLIDKGILSLMCGHIVQPAVTMKKNPALSYEDCLPGSLCPELLTGVLREEFGFNGVITSDATIMGGFTMAMKRRDALPAAIMAGCDMLVFNTDFEEDYGFLLEAVRDGRITAERLDEAVTRILALKAVLTTRKYEDAEIDGLSAAAALADKAVTLVKDTTAEKGPDQRILPLTGKKYDIVRLVILGEDRLYNGSAREIAEQFFQERGFETEVYEPYKDDLSGTGNLPGRRITVYLANEQTASNRTTVRLTWCKKHALDIPRFVNEEPSAFISLSNPYHLLDIPRIPVYINTYSATRELLLAALKKLCGESGFKGVSPVDAFCGLRDTGM